MEPIKLTQVSDPKNLKDTVNQLIGEVTALQNDKVKLQSKTVTPTKDIQLVEPDEEYAGLSVVAVHPIPDEYVTPSGSLTITENNKYNVTSYAEVDVAVPVPELNLQEKSVTPTKQIQSIKPDPGFDGLDQVLIGAIPEQYIEPAGNMPITQNGDYDVKTVANVSVRVTGEAVTLQQKTVTPTKVTQRVVADVGYTGLSEVEVTPIPDEYIIPSGTEKVTANGTYNIKDKENVEVAVPSEAPTLITKEITENGTYNASADNADGFSSVTVNVAGSGVNGLQWKCDNMKTLNREFSGYLGTSLDEPLSGLDTSKVENFGSCFAGCTNITTIPQIDISSASGSFGLISMFQNCANLLTIPNLNTSNNTNFGYMFAGCSSLTEVPELDMRKASNISYMFQNCHALTDWEIDLSSATSATYMFNKSSGDRKFKNTSKLKQVNYMFAEASCENIEGLDLSAVTDMSNFCYRNTAIKSFIHPETGKCSNFTSAFQGCTSLTTLSLNVYSDQYNLGYIRLECPALTNLTLKNIRTALTISNNTSYGLMLTVDSLIGIIQELWDYSSSSSTKKLTMGATNLAKLANVYVKLVGVTDEMTAEDQYIANKKPCVVCESTDEGAMTITEYATSKKWTLV